MNYIKSTPNSSGAYQGPRSVPFPGCLPLTDGQAETLVELLRDGRIRKEQNLLSHAKDRRE